MKESEDQITAGAKKRSTKNKRSRQKNDQATLAEIKLELERKVQQKTKELEEFSEKLDLINGELEDTKKRLHKKREYLINSERMISVGQMTASIVHEINNPLTAIISLVSAISMECKDSHKVTRYNNMLVHNINKLRSLTFSILSFVNPVTYDSVEYVDINSAIEELVAFYGYEIKKKDIQFSTELSGNLPNLLMPKIKIQQVILNVLKNAVFAVEAETGKVTVKTSKENGHIKIEVEDNGKGISKQAVKNIFTPFFSTKEKKEGSGLGLFICKEILDKYHGTIDVNSVHGKLTTFSIKLPIAKIKDNN